MDNRVNILEQAVVLFSSRGYDAVGVQEIVEKSGITKPTLYHYFGSKKGLLENLLKVNYDEFTKKLLITAGYKGDLVLTLREIVQEYFNLAKNAPVFFRMQLAMQFLPVDNEAYQMVLPYIDKHYNLIENVFIKAVKENGNMEGRHKRYAATFIGMINTYAAMSLNAQFELSKEQEYLAVHQFMHGILS